MRIHYLTRNMGNYLPIIDKITGKIYHWGGRDFKLCLAGGAIRDFVMGVKPKDFDIFIIGQIDSGLVYEALLDNFPEIFKGSEQEFFQGYKLERNDAFSAYVDNVTKVKTKSGVLFDIIAPQNNCTHPMEVMENFDYTFNKLAYSKAFSANIFHFEETFGEVRYCKDLDNLDKKRYEKFKDKLYKYLETCNKLNADWNGWGVDEQLRQHNIMKNYDHLFNEKGVFKNKTVAVAPAKKATLKDIRKAKYYNNPFKVFFDEDKW